MNPTVSVVIPIYGDFDEKRLQLVLESCKDQKGLDIEIIVSEQNIEPKFKTIAQESGVIYVHSFPEIEKDGTQLFNTGFVRNEGVRASSGDFLYLTDADIIFMDSFYIFNLMQLSKAQSKKALIKPPMIRLLDSSFLPFFELTKKKGVKGALEKLNFSQKYIASLMPSDYKLRIVKHQEKILTISEDQFKAYKSDPLLKPFAPSLFYDTVHCGGIFVTRQLFDAVAGYCELFYKWGYEDSDLQWKLGELVEVISIPLEECFKVLHLDHSKPYFSPDQNEKNKGVAEERMKETLVNVREKDLKGGKSRYISVLREK